MIPVWSQATGSAASRLTPVGHTKSRTRQHKPAIWAAARKHCSQAKRQCINANIDRYLRRNDFLEEEPRRRVASTGPGRRRERERERELPDVCFHSVRVRHAGPDAGRILYPLGQEKSREIHTSTSRLSEFGRSSNEQVCAESRTRKPPTHVRKEREREGEREKMRWKIFVEKNIQFFPFLSPPAGVGVFVDPMEQKVTGHIV